MYKTSTLLFLLLTFAFSATAQTTNCDLVAGFTVAASGPNTFHFQNTTTGLSNTDSIRWTFGDGTSSNQVSPSHTFAQAGSYNVCIRIQKRNSSGVLTNCVRELCHVVIVVTQNTCALTAAFTAALISPNTFHFQNTSLGLSPNDSIRWTFGDGTSSYQYSPNHTYAQPGNYTVCIRIQKRNVGGTLSNCVREYCRNVIVEGPSHCSMVAGFTTTMTGTNTFHFQNTTTGLSTTDSIRWTFGDGTSSNQVSPSHTFAQAGNYNVCIRIQKRNSAGTLSNCVRELCRIVNVGTSNTCTLTAAFTAALISPNTFHFQNTSLGLSPNDSIRWTFGDGTSSYQFSPNHTYAQPGNYTVCIRIQKRNTGSTLSNCVREYCRNVIVEGPSHCSMVAGFTTTMTGTNTFHFQNTTTGLSTTDSIRWTFGDGTSSNQVSPTHTFAQPGHYNVCIRIQKRNTAGTLSNCVKEFCRVVNVDGQTNCSLIAGFTTTLIAPNSYHFQNTTVGLLPTDSIRWTFGDGRSSNQVSPNHTYAQAGQYNVCLRIQRRNNAGSLSNCVREVCHRVAPTSNSSCALPYPNPATNHVNVQVPLGRNQMIHVYIYNASNVLVKQHHQSGYVGGNLITIRIADLIQGVYTMKVVHENNICITSFVKL